MKQLGLNMNILDQAKRVFRQDVPVMEKKKPTTPTVLRPHKDVINRRTSPRLMKKHPSTSSGDAICIEDKGKMKVHNEEVYTWEHEKLLGDCKSPWPLFDDQNVKRLYDSVNGITCHQCRQKTLGPRTECSICHRSHGRLCGKCLYIRYGENLLEVKEKESWKCPVCRGICNCSRCREQKGWPPTGSIHDHVHGKTGLSAPLFCNVSTLEHKVSTSGNSAAGGDFGDAQVVIIR
ncbi:UNVERIFIED_CONTAM: Cell division cycle-associated protein 7 [Sesamum radiatum]|uniref:Cell division cycle-associated protein 7 n=1 Tax=Sesamum radiatum TaxID=300843 RepID=A0AAW2S177_SESRA